MKQPKYLSVILVIFCLLLSRQGIAQHNFGFNFVFLTWHPDGDRNAFLQPNRLDDEAKLVLNWGGVLSYERFIYRRKVSIKLAQAAYSDCAQLFAGHTHIALRLQPLNSQKHALRFGFGPTWVYRQSWYRFPGYVQENKYLKTQGDWQTAFVWYGGEIEYDYAISRHFDLGLHIIPGIPDFFTFGIGLRYWPHRIPNNKEWKSHPARKKWFYGKKDLF